jgi:hypothetical protein
VRSSIIFLAFSTPLCYHKEVKGVCAVKKTFTFRVDDTLWQKFHAVAEGNKRSVNNQLEVLVSDFVSAHERENGEIQLDSAK